MNFSKRKAIQQKFVEWRLLNVLNVTEVAISSVIGEIQNLALQQNTEEEKNIQLTKYLSQQEFHMSINSSSNSTLLPKCVRERKVYLTETSKRNY